MHSQDFTVGIASPCSSSWEEMHGDEKHRFCHLCSDFVHNLDELDEEEKFDLIRMAQTKNSDCARIYTRRDGTVKSCDCPAKAAPAGARKKESTTQAVVALGVVVAGFLLAFNVMRTQLIQQLGTTEYISHSIRY